jgi:tetratricopeptide (TPR) repeat protein
MQRQADWAKGKADEFDMLQARAEVAACAGKLAEARSLYQQGIEAAQRSKNDDPAAFMLGELALTEALFGNPAPARDRAAKALSISHSSYGSFMSGIALAAAGDPRALQVTSEMEKRFPLNTTIREMQVPVIQASLEINKGSFDHANQLLDHAKPYEFGWVLNVMPAYLRGQSYMGQKNSKAAEAEFQKLLGHRFLCATSVYCSLAHLQLGRAYVAQGDTAKARTSYQDFLGLWKDADSDIPVLKQAKAEYAKLQ